MRVGVSKNPRTRTPWSLKMRFLTFFYGYRLDFNQPVQGKAGCGFNLFFFSRNPASPHVN
jgi:hypothetical protein